MAEHGCGHEPYFKDNADRWKEITIGNDSVRFPVSAFHPTSTSAYGIKMVYKGDIRGWEEREGLNF